MVYIDKIKVGDAVWAEEPSSEKKELKNVTNVFVNETKQLIHLVVDGERLRTTDVHPFWVEGEGWIPAGALKEGDQVRLQSGELGEIEQTRVVVLNSPIKVYNFEVEDYHTYFVSAQKILVHNANKNGCAERVPTKRIIKNAQLPTKGKIRYIPPKGVNKLPKKGRGYIDKFGNICIKGPSRTKGEDFEWDVQLSRRGKEMLGHLSPDGKHLNVSLKGRVTH